MKLLKRLFIILIIITSIMLINSLLFPNVVVDNSTVTVGSEYTPNVTVYNLFTNIKNYKIIKNNINTNVIGNYNLIVNVKYLYFNFNKKIKVKVIDNVKPIINLKGDNITYVCPNSSYIEDGYTASDNYDGDLTNNVIVNKFDDMILYSVIDNSNNKSITKRQLVYKDNIQPIITLNDSNSITIYQGSTFNEPGYKAMDNCNGDITDKVMSTGDVDVNTIGTYKIKYEVEDISGNKAEIEREVIVKSRPINNVKYYGNGSIYLTFDDGSSYLTSRILDILDSEGVEATFFVCSANEYTKRAYNSGHTIALHSATHNYSYIYSSVSNYFSDLDNLSNNINNLIGIRPNIIRFPGGSSNTISKKYAPGIMSTLVSEVSNRGYIYFDWNVDSNDAGGDGSNSTKIYNNVVKNLSHSKTNVVLMHDSNGHDATVDALRNIIKYGKENGYSFKAITSDTPVVHHGVSN